MAYNKLAIETLTKKLNELVLERSALTERLDAEIKEIKDGIRVMRGLDPKSNNEPEITFDDTNPDYIKGSIED